jgi:hypothetical protein
MESHGLTLNGPLLVQKLSTLPSWTSDDEGRLIYVEDVDTLYYGNDSEWIEPATPESDLKKYSIL